MESNSECTSNDAALTTLGGGSCASGVTLRSYQVREEGGMS